MAFAAITYRVKPGNEDRIAEIFGRFKRVDTPEMTGEDGSTGRLLGTAVFIKDEFVVRVIHYEGDFALVARHMGRQKGVHLLEEALSEYLAEPRDTSTPEGWASYFKDATMRRISQLSVADHVAASSTVD